MAAIGNRDEDELIDVALILIDIFDDGVRVALNAVGLTLERSHRILEGALLELTAVFILKLILSERHFHRENLEETLLDADVVVVLYDIDHAVPDDVGDIHTDTLTHEGVAALLVDDRTLLVHHIIVFEQVLTDTEVVLLHLLLGALNAAADHRAFDTLTILEAEAVHDFGDALRTELTHQLILERNVEHR